MVCASAGLPEGKQHPGVHTLEESSVRFLLDDTGGDGLQAGGADGG